MKTYKDIASFSQWSSSEKDAFTIATLKGLVMDAVHHADSGHTGGALSSADFAYILFTEFLNLDPDDPDWINRDRFVLSAGHESMLLYSLLHYLDLRSIDDLKQFRQLGSNTPGHPEVETVGVEATTGPLGQGVAMGIGMAVAESYLSQLLGSEAKSAGETLNHFTYVLVGDGDLQEPVSLGAAALAGHWGLAKLILYYDANAVQISGPTSRSDSTEVDQLFRSLQWDVQMIDGHDHKQIRSALLKAKQSSRPSIIIGKTVMGKGLATQEGQASTHGSPLSAEEISATKLNLGLPLQSFWTAPECRDHFQRRFPKLRQQVKTWKKHLADVGSDTFAALWSVLFDQQAVGLTQPDFSGKASMSTRKAFGLTLEHFAAKLPQLVGGSADLEPSNQTAGFATAYGDFSRQNRGGRNFAFGVREFPMAALLNGMALHGGLIPFGGTFLVFADYSRAAIRLSALQQLRVIHVFTHDSFYVGEDGPTHQPVEQLASLRAIPNLKVFRPADANETAVCFRIAMELKDQPSALILTRQNVPNLDLEPALLEAGVRKGGYCVSECKGKPEIVLIATGSEVSLALEVARSMIDKRVRVVSLPCWKLFDQQSELYRRNLIPPRGCLKVSIEAGVTLGWDKYTGPNSLKIGLDRFGASAPAGDLAEYFGFTAKAVETKIRDYLAILL